MPNNSVPEGLVRAFKEAAKTIRDGRRGTVGTLSVLVGEVEVFARRTPSKDLRKLYFALGFYDQYSDPALNAYMKSNFREKLLHPVSVPDPADPKKTIKLDLSAQLRWISWAYDDFAGLFGDQSEDFYYQEARKKLVPDYIDEATFPVVCEVLIESYKDSIKALRQRVLAMLDRIGERLRESQVIEATEELWEHFLLLHQEASEWPPV